MKTFAAVAVVLTALSSTAIAAPSPSQPLHKRAACQPAFISFVKAQVDDLCYKGVVIEQKDVKFTATTADIKYDGKYGEAAGVNSQPLTLAKGGTSSIFICQSCSPPAPMTTRTPERS